MELIERFVPLDYPFDNYLISNFGRVKRKRDDRIMKCGKSRKRDWYYAVYCCRRDGKIWSLYLAAEVYRRFSPIPLVKGAKLIYIDGNTLNCRIDNLRMCRGYEVKPSEIQIKNTVKRSCLA